MYRIQYPIRFFDISLREGLQTITKEYRMKQNIIKDIVQKYKPESMEIGQINSSNINSNVNSNTTESIKLYNYSQILGGCCNFYLSVLPSYELIKYADYNNVRNISLTTSASNMFQSITQCKSTDTTYSNINDYLSQHNQFQRVKLNITCINRCPIDNKLIDNVKIIDEISRYCKFNKIKEFCLVDTCGTLRYDDFQDIIDDILEEMGPGRLSLRLYIKNGRRHEVNKIISAAMFRGIYKFDVCDSQDKTYLNNVHISQNVTYENISENFSPIWK